MHKSSANISMKSTQPLPLGAFALKQGIRFAIDLLDCTEKTVLIIYRKSTGEKLCEIVMNDYPSCGSVYAVLVEGLQGDSVYYQYQRQGEFLEDPYGMKLYGCEHFGEITSRKTYEPFEQKAILDEDEKPAIPYEESILYKLHVRGFTKHASSQVRKRGTFAGIVQKIDYLKSLGVNGLVLMPPADFAEIQERKKQGPPLLQQATAEEPEILKNCWGYGPAQFFAPKASYAAGDPEIEFMEMVKALHQNGIEVILEFLFPKETPTGRILDCLRFWTYIYHVDGFWLNREVVPMEMVAQDPVLKGSKLICGNIDAEKIYGEETPDQKVLATAGDDFQNTMRRFLKGDENCLGAFVKQSTNCQNAVGSVHYITSQNGFTLADLVSYNQKHNEANGEENRDGTENNFSWNCGVEGKTRSRKVLRLRKRQMYNAMIFLLFSQGTPMIYAGDEFGRSQQGNNNAYNQDNELFWLNWRDQKKNADLLDFVRKAIRLRKEHPVLHPAKPFRWMDYLSCGFPDISLHGVKPWKASFLSEDRFVGILYYGKYAQKDGQEDCSFYFAYNMYWEEIAFALPTLPKNQAWIKVADTFEKEPFSSFTESALENCKIGARSIQIYQSIEVKVEPSDASLQEEDAKEVDSKVDFKEMNEKEDQKEDAESGNEEVSEQ